MEMDTSTDMVFVLDDDTAVCEAIAELIALDHLTVKTFNRADDFFVFYQPSYRGCLVLDVRMPNMSGLEIQAELMRRQIEIPIIFISAHSHISVVSRTMKLGAIDFLIKPYEPQQLLESVHTAMKLSIEWHKERLYYEQFSNKLSTLSKREMDVLKLLYLGMSSKSIGKELNISFKTVDIHRAKIFTKLKVSTIIELVQATAEFLHNERLIMKRCSNHISTHGIQSKSIHQDDERNIST